MVRWEIRKPLLLIITHLPFPRKTRDCVPEELQGGFIPSK